MWGLTGTRDVGPPRGCVSQTWGRKDTLENYARLSLKGAKT